MPIIGIVASSFPRAVATGAYDALASITLNATTPTITFAGIPLGYRHLQIRALTVTSSNSGSGATLRFNDDTSSVYYTHSVLGSGSGTASNYNNASNIIAPNFNGGAATAAPGSAVIDILDYSSNTKSKTVMSLDGYDANGSGYVALTSGLYSSTTPITSITFSLTNYLSGAQFSLYGVK